MKKPATETRPVDAPAATYVGVALDIPVDRLFTYRVPTALTANARVGHRVTVPFRRRQLTGIVAELQSQPPVAGILDVLEAPDTEPLLDEALLSLGRFVARYYGTSLGEALAAMVPRGVRMRGKGAVRIRVTLATDATEAPAGTNDAQERVLRWLRKFPEGFVLAELCRRAHVSPSPIHTLAKRGLVDLERERADEDALVDAAEASAERAKPHRLTEEQRVAVEALEAALEQRAYAPFLLLGITGSGKTEVYLQAIESCRAQGRQAVVLVPEIALTPQTVRRFRARFERVAVLHSAMTEADRARAWKRIRAGEADVVIGPRSAIFAPVPRLGLIVVDEEHETSFKQQNAPRYHARDVGLLRARDTGAVVVLGTATPSLETYRHALKGRYALLRMTRRVPGREPPSVQIVDMRQEDERAGRRLDPSQGTALRYIGRTLEVRVSEALRTRGQVILLQNRRGFATSVACRRCGFVVNCKQCDVALTYHRSDALALCHLCGHESKVPPACPDCAFPSLRLQGVGTQTVEDEIAHLFPKARIARMDSDTMATREAYEDVLGRFGRREIDVLVGTQMIAKGLDFPGVTLVGIISADTALALPDFRSAERTFSLVAQVAGRAGRGKRSGRVVVQTNLPEHPAIRLAADQDFDAFAAHELQERKQFGYAPFARLLRVVVRGKNEREVVRRADETCRLVVRTATPATQILGPAVPPIERVQGRVRRHLLIKAPDHREIAMVLRALRAAKRPRGGVEETWDVDPVGVL